MKEIHPNVYDIDPPFINYYEPVRKFAESKGAKFEIDDHTMPPLQLFISDIAELHRKLYIFTLLENIAMFEKRISGYGISISAYYDKDNLRYLYFKKIKRFNKMPSTNKIIKILNYSWYELSLIKKDDLLPVCTGKRDADWKHICVGVGEQRVPDDKNTNK